MIRIRKSTDRGHANHGWLDTYHSFSFADYFDPEETGYSVLRVINDDRIAPGGGFPTHGHANMEIITYLLEGALQHRDSTGSASVIRAGEVQRMSAGRGIAHSEFNASQDEPVHLLQIWLLPDQTNVVPGYEQKNFPAAEKRGRLRLIASPDGREDSLSLHQDAFLYATLLGEGETLSHPLRSGRHAYLHLAHGALSLNGESLAGGDGARIEDVPEIRLEGRGEAEILLFDLP